MQDIVNENVAVDAVDLVTCLALVHRFVLRRRKRFLAAVARLGKDHDFGEGGLLKVGHRKKVVIRTGQMRRRYERQSARDALDGQFTIFAQTLRTVVSDRIQFARLVCAIDVAHAHRQLSAALLLSPTNSSSASLLWRLLLSMWEAHFYQRKFLRLCRWWRVYMRQQLILEVRIVQNGSVSATRGDGHLPTDSDFSRETDHRAPDSVRLQLLNGHFYVAGIACREAAHYYENLPTRMAGHDL